MAKKKKTRKQKILADHRQTSLSHQPDNPVTEQTNQPQNFTFEFKGGPISQPRAKAATLDHSYTHLRHDLTKTVILVTAIMATQLILYFIINYL